MSTILNSSRVATLPTNFAALFFSFFILVSTQSAFAATVSYSQSFSTGWNLAGNDLTTPIDVKTTFGAQTNVMTVWKWNAASSQWAFYSPALDTLGTLSGYAQSKGYSVLSAINPGEGFWVNTLAPISLGTQSGTGFSLAVANLATGWNLVATGDSVITPATFTANVGNVTTLWAWDNTRSAWYFYAPLLAANNTLASYIQSKGYENFGPTLDGGLGFWVNYSGVNSTPPSNNSVATVAAVVIGVM